MLNQQAKRQKEFNSALTQDPMSKIKEHIEANKNIKTKLHKIILKQFKI